MKKNYLILLCCFLLQTFVHAADRYWVGPQGGNWTDKINWSLTIGGVGGAGRPAPTDAVIFSGNALVNVNVSAIIYSLRTSFGNNMVTLYTTIGSTLTIVNSLRVEAASTLKDSTGANVAFNVVFSGANHATGTIYGDWIFEGGVPLSGGSNNGARFTAEEGSVVTVTSTPFNPGVGGRIIFKKNTNKISSSATTLKFSYASYFVLDNNLNAAIPAATWAKDSVRAPNTYSGFLGAPASTIQITGVIGQLQFSGGVTNYGRMLLDLYGLTADANLALPDGSKIRGNLEILNTNNYTLTLLASTSATSSVQVEVGTPEAGYLFGGYLNISGATTKVALAKATAAAPATSYKLLVNKSYSQTGGNFSLQNYNNATGSSILDIKGDMVQTGGTFITNSTSTSASAKFIVVMADPAAIVGPSGSFASVRNINMSSGTIDNSRHMVTLRIDHTVYNFPDYIDLPNGVLLQSPLEVGKLDLVRSPLTTSATNLLTVSNPGINAITVGATGNSYINGPLRRATNSKQYYFFPTGKGNSTVTAYSFDSCSVVPASATPSVYQAEYFKNGYNNVNITALLKGIDITEYWDIEKISGSDAQVSLTLNAAVAGAAATDGIVIANYVNGQWVSEQGSVLTPGTAANGSVLSKPLSSVGPFTFGYINSSGLTPVTGSGLSYKYYQGNFTSLPDFNAMAPVKTGTVANVDISVRPAGTNDGFAFIWQGYINIPSPGNYTFETVSDDGSKLYFNIPYNANAVALIDNDGNHAAQSVTGTVNVPAAGVYPITITFFENYGSESMQLYWSGPGFARQLVPDAAFGASAAPATNGLNYKYYEGDFNLLPDYTALTPVKTGISNNVNIGVRTADVNDHFAFMWYGYINLPAAGTYTFETISDDGSKVYFNMPYSVNGSSTVNNDGLHASQSATGTITVAAAGKYPISVTFFEKDGEETMQLYWSGPGISRQPVPDAAFTATDNTVNNTAVTSEARADHFNGLIDGTAAITAYPNPFVESFTIDYYNSGSVASKVSIGLYDLKGRLMYTYQPATLTAGYNKWIVNTGSENLPAGVYMAQIKVNGVPFKTVKLIKTKI